MINVQDSCSWESLNILWPECKIADQTGLKVGGYAFEHWSKSIETDASNFF